MDTSVLKSVFISSKNHKLSLLISSKEVSALSDFLELTINEKVLILNTNLGIEIYYQSDLDYTNLITHSFLLISSKGINNGTEYRIAAFSTFPELKNGLQQMLERLNLMPLAFGCYSKSIMHQLDKNYEKNNQLIGSLFTVWKQILMMQNLNEQSNFKLKQFEKTLEDFGEKSNVNAILKQLIANATNAMRQN
ncbi:MAG: hypothetical protein Q8K04_13210 [Lutibacter sp.]|nr:hypothetical protein [Lutibacter sp.]MDP3945281.1 hypothetical protein [Lutibacter sp.]